MGNDKANEKRFLAFDLGSDMIRAAVAEINDQSELEIESIKETKALGIHHGVIVNLTEVQKSISNIVRDLKTDVDELPQTVFVGISGKDLKFVHASGCYTLPEDRNNITQGDVDKSHESARSSIQFEYGRYVIHTIIEEYIINSTPKIRNPLNLPGNRIETKMLLLSSSEEMRESYSLALESCGIKVDRENFCYSTLCASELLLTEDQKKNGAIVIDIGNESSNMIAYQGGRIIFAGEVPFGSANVSQDLQYILQRSREEADRIKSECCTAYLPLADPDNLIIMPGTGTVETIKMPETEVSQIISARYAEILIMLKEKLSNASKFLAFANGIYLMGGAAHQKGLAELASDIFSLPVHLGCSENIKGLAHECAGPKYVNVISLLKYNLNDRLMNKDSEQDSSDVESGKGMSKMKRLFRKFF